MNVAIITADTITKDQLREVLACAIIHRDHGLERYALIALGFVSVTVSIVPPEQTARPDGLATPDIRWIRDAHARCAEALNARVNQVLAVHRHDDDANDRTSYAARGFTGGDGFVNAGVHVAGKFVHIEVGGQDQVAALRELETRLMLAIADIRATISDLMGGATCAACRQKLPRFNDVTPHILRDACEFRRTQGDNPEGQP